MQWFDSIKSYAHGVRNCLVSEKEEIKCHSIVKWYKKWLTLMTL